MTIDASPAVPTNWTSGDLPLASHTRFQSSDLEMVRAHMSGVFCPHTLGLDGDLSSLSFLHNQARLRSLSFNATSYGEPGGKVTVRVPECEDIHLIQFSLQGSAEIRHHGTVVQLAPNQMCMLGLRDGVAIKFDSGYKHFSVKVPTALLMRLLADEIGPRTEPVIFSPEPMALTGPVASFARMVRTVCDDIDGGIAGFLHNRVVDNVESMLVRLLLAGLPHNYSHLFETAPTMVAPYYVRRVEQFIEAHAGEPITLADMIAVSGVSGRSLHAGFRRFRNDTPMGFLKRRRLENARQALLRGRPEGERSVTEIALAAGFSHLSKFARDYQLHFGERPSDTLRRNA